MKIAHVTATFPPYWGGTGNVAYYNALELARRGHEVHVFTAQFALNDYCDPEEISVHRLWTPFRIGNAPLTPTLTSRLKNFDLIHLHWPFIFGAELTWLAYRLTRKPYVMTYHLDLRAEIKWIFGPYQRFWGPVLVGSATKVLAVTEDHLKSSLVYPYIKRRPEDIIEVSNGVDITQFNPRVSGHAVRDTYNIPDDACVIIFVGAMDKAHEYKGVPDLINVFGTLNSSNVWLLLVGGGDLLPTYKLMTTNLPLHSQKQIIFIDSTAHNQLPLYYAAADFCVLPSRLPESFGMVLIEAMACGKPVIASDSPGVRSVVMDENEGLLVRQGDSADLLAKIQIMISDPERCREMGQNGCKKVEAKYAWSVVAQRLEDAYISAVYDFTRGELL